MTHTKPPKQHHSTLYNGHLLGLLPSSMCFGMFPNSNTSASNTKLFWLQHPYWTLLFISKHCIIINFFFWVASCEVRNLQLRHFRLWDIGFKTLRRRPRIINITVQLRLPFDQFLFFCCLLKNKNDDESFSTVNRSVHRFDRLYNHNNISALVSFILQLSQSCSAIRIKHFWEEKRNMLVLKIHSAQTHSSKFTKGYGWKIYGEITRLSERIGNVSKSYSIFF